MLKWFQKLSNNKPTTQVSVAIEEKPTVVIYEHNNMLPTIKSGTKCVVNTKYSYQRLKPGDVVCYTNDEDILYISRVMHSFMGDGWTLKSDNRDAEEPEPLSEQNYIGLVATT